MTEPLHWSPEMLARLAGGMNPPASLEQQRALLRDFVGWISGDVPERVEVLRASADRFLKARYGP